MKYVNGWHMKKKKNSLVYEDEDIYDENYVEELLEDDEISEQEEAFMIGYNDS
ncbi:hypothetical protein HYX18_01355 [Candidatus Woesearchaeota archaeon]|nr:hypothetical protein [Candidatus Woesearchaeota archaeon]